jgi:diaminopimelate epimerase
MELSFTKYQGTGNDFIMLDGREGLPLAYDDYETIERLCDRKFGIGADGLIIIENSKVSDFKMVYFNADGRQSTMCGNGGRCIIYFAKSLGLIEQDCTFEAIDGLHTGVILQDDPPLVRLGMNEVKSIKVKAEESFELNTGSPHYIKFVNTFPQNFVEQAIEIRMSNDYSKEGINVNFVLQESPSNIEIRTFERGVEDETLSCGTGVTAAAIAYAHMKQMEGLTNIQVHTQGGELSVNFDAIKGHYKAVELTGPVRSVFSGIINI